MVKERRRDRPAERGPAPSRLPAWLEALLAPGPGDARAHHAWWSHLAGLAVRPTLAGAPRRAAG